MLSLQDGSPRTPGIEAISEAGLINLDNFERCKIRGRILGLIRRGRDEEFSGPEASNPGVVEVIIIDWTRGVIKAVCSVLHCCNLLLDL